MDTVLDAWRACVEAGILDADPAQEDAATRLSEIDAALSGRRRGLFGKPGTPRGLWLHGPVGTGKSMLMDMAFERARTPAKRRIHFHDFMAGAHAHIAEWRRLDDRARRRRPDYVRGAGDDPIPPAARSLAGGMRLLCLDEAEITDIADAMLVGRLFEQILAQNITLIVTSNRAPEGLYADGINRQLFLPFIALIRDRLDVLRLDSGRDYRRRALEEGDLWLAPETAENRGHFEDLWRHMTAGSGEHAETLNVSGRALTVPHAAASCCRFEFGTLCAAALGAADYLAIARRYRALFLQDVPRMAREERDKARRFVTLIDALYEAECALVALAEAEPDALYIEGDYAYEFRRAASRIAEMRRGGG